MSKYEVPECPKCKVPLLIQRVYHKPRTFAITPEGQVAEVNLTPNLPEVLDFENLTCARCQAMFNVKYDREIRVFKGSKI
ncbi:MAG: hypothetical protein ACM3PE_09160 [Deltaproteobacteria bacterium]